MKAINELRKRRALSPVIATVIIVAVTITVAVAVSYWLSGIASQYTGFEKVEIQSAYAQKSHLVGETVPGSDDYKGWKITLQLQNTGTGEATLSDCFINDIPLEQYNSEIYWKYLDTTLETPAEADLPLDGLTLPSGVKQLLYVYILKENTAETAPDSGLYVWGVTAVTFTSGTTINVKIHSAAGMDYIRLVRLP